MRKNGDASICPDLNSCAIRVNGNLGIERHIADDANRGRDAMDRRIKSEQVHQAGIFRLGPLFLVNPQSKSLWKHNEPLVWKTGLEIDY